MAHGSVGVELSHHLPCVHMSACRRCWRSCWWERRRRAGAQPGRPVALRACRPGMNTCRPLATALKAAAVRSARLATPCGLGATAHVSPSHGATVTASLAAPRLLLPAPGRSCPRASRSGAPRTRSPPSLSAPHWARQVMMFTREEMFCTANWAIVSGHVGLIGVDGSVARLPVEAEDMRSPPLGGQ
jgi:hypothetical protein